ncbi:hypothetical protein HRW23_02350 [Streptomyces lunaelactis]|uniref:hypothetical protein n=1 Tax=Streptomyces lunaelactis TaxID=1535768 RepID=UPI00158470BC|nr:hypothetical protein [Streptomyces lunaelactis]NUK03629.1 hypothetical protein [Streptomyces lunaelactis]NUK10589.1 hypothetical protein [Streptomyces lunaelactis]NUK18057.1 hypothetical protein [Streptomyces lunaelactis]NUK25327.1 hypothetical protein [Streptomyces lunaelactis]NUK36860.1 hypothetical protein [Streptomyces lunaelactis]
MGSEGRRTVRRPQAEENVCPACGQPVGTVIKRRKTLGAYIPVWGPGPCRNPDCARHAEDVVEKPYRWPRRKAAHQLAEKPGEEAAPGPGKEPDAENRA